MTHSYQCDDFPLVSVIIPARDAAGFIARTLKSVLNQTHRHLEVLVVDDGSWDNTPIIVKAIARQDSRVQLFRQANQGVAAARNLAIAHARGEYIAPIDADDLWFPTKLEKQVRLLSQAPATVGVIYTGSIFIDEHDSLGDTCQIHPVEGDVYIPLLYSNLLGNASTPLIRRSCLEQVGGYDSQFWQQGAQGCEDWDLYLRLAERYEFRVVPEILVGYRRVTSSMSFKHQTMQRSREILFTKVQQQHPEIPARLLRWAQSSFDWYIAKCCQQCGDHRSAIAYQFRAIRLDYLPLLRPGFYKLFLLSLLRLLLGRSQQTISAQCPPGSPSLETVYDSPQFQEDQLRRYSQFPHKHYSNFVLWRCQTLQKQLQFMPSSTPSVSSQRSLQSSL